MIGNAHQHKTKGGVSLSQFKKHSETGQSVFLGSVKWFATMVAIIVAFLLTPKVYDWTIVWIVDYTTDHYGYGLEDLIRICWGIVLTLTIFFLSRATLSTGIVMGGLTLASRMF